MKKTLPHNQSVFFSTNRYWKAVESFCEHELKNDGEDITSHAFLKNKTGSVLVIAKEKGILAGKDELQFFLEKFFPTVEGKWRRDITNGDSLKKNQKIFSATGNAYDLMKMERIFLNILSRMSGIATTTQRIHSSIKKSSVQISATRKTQWSYLDKKSVSIGGGLTHRIGLFDAIMIKENHQILGKYNLDIQNFLNTIEGNIYPQFLEIEVETPEEFWNIFTLFWEHKNTTLPKVIMLDNFSPDQIQKTLQQCPQKTAKKARHQKNIFLEASGGISETNIQEYAHLDIDVVSMGFLTNNTSPIDFSMRAYSISDF